MIKTRFAPSPTGYLHVGGLRTALYAYLFARQKKGVFLLRIEDTDQKRFVEGAAENLQDTLKYYGLEWDEGPYFQSERTEIYREHAKMLLEEGKAYRCFCTSERLQEMREAQQKAGRTPKYDRHCLRLSDDEKQSLYNAGKPFVVRQLIPDEYVEFHDEVRGDMTFHGRDVDDQVLIKSDNFPTYHLANVVDDHLMGITHVIRGEEWLPSTPKHVWLYQAFGWEAPVFAHLPLLLNPDKTKLSKRQGDVAAEDYIKKGYIKEAMLNFIAFLGWNPGTEQEIFSMGKLVETFDLARVQKAGAVFSLEKLDWFNGQYLRSMPTQELAQIVLKQCADQDWYTGSLTETELTEGTTETANDFIKYTACIQTRMKSLNDGAEMIRPFLLEKLDYNTSLFEHAKMKVDKAAAHLAIEKSLESLENHDDFTHDALKALIIEVIQGLGVKNGQVMWPLRVALTNEEYSPGAFELMEVMGKEKSLSRLRDSLAALE